MTVVPSAKAGQHSDDRQLVDERRDEVTFDDGTVEEELRTSRSAEGSPLSEEAFHKLKLAAHGLYDPDNVRRN